MNVLVELRVQREQGAAAALQTASAFNVSGFELDADYEPVPMSPPSSEEAAALEATREEIVLVRGAIDESRLEELRAQDQVVNVWLDTPIAPFDGMGM